MQGNQATRTSQCNPNQMNIDTLKELAHHCSQTEAAAFAVLASHVRDNIASNTRTGVESEDQPIEDLISVLKFLEDAMVNSIARSDGNVVMHIGHAARQLNPLLS